MLAVGAQSGDNALGTAMSNPMWLRVTLGDGGQHEMERSMRHPEMQTTLLLFDDVQRAFQAATVLRHLREGRHLRIGGASLLHRDADGALHIDEFDDLTPMQGVAGGLLLGLVVGALFSPTVISAAVSAAIVGGLIGRFVDRGITDADLQQVGQLVPPQQSGLVVVAQPADIELLLTHVSGHTALLSPSIGPALLPSTPLPGSAAPRNAAPQRSPSTPPTTAPTPPTMRG